jgi:hypothetical protein
MDSITDADL